jgi:hypothetical protein
MGYTTYVFACQDELINESKYIMCTRFPNWDHRIIELGEIGYLKFLEVRAGVDTWFDGNKMVPYRYNDLHFIKFVEKPRRISQKEYIM